MYQTILFDFDGTLCSSIATIVIALQKTFKHFGRPVPSQAAIAKMASSGPDLIGSFYQLDPELGPLDDATLDAWSTYYRATYKASDVAHSDLYPGIVDLLEALSEQGTEMLIVSNKSIESIQRSLDAFHIRSFFTEIYGDSLQHPSKPDPGVFINHILPTRPDHALSDFLMVGDTQTDCQFALACGIDMGWVEYGYGQPDSDILSNLKFRFESPHAILKQLNTLKSDG